MGNFYLGQIRDGNDIRPVFVGRIDNDSIGFYDDKGKLLAAWNPPVPLEAAKEYRDRPPAFLTQIDSLWTDILQGSVSIDSRSREIEAIAKELELDVEDILCFTSLEMSQKIQSRMRESDQILADKETAETDEAQNPNVISDHVDIKSEVALNELVDDRYTLADILGVSDPNATLICVNSCDIKGGKGSNSEFSLLIKYPDGRMEKAPMLSQDDGTSPDRDIYSANRDGSDVDKITARSMYRIHSPLGDYMISTTYGDSGTLNLQLGQRDPTEQDYIAVPLEDQKYTRFVTKEVQDVLDPERGMYRANKSTDEVSNHMGRNCKTTLAEADGDENTGHQHIEKEPDENYYLTVARDIWEAHPDMSNLYNNIEGLAKDLENYLLKYPDKTADDFVQDREAAADRYDRHIY